MASTSVVFEILAQDRASSKFNDLSRAVDHSGNRVSRLGTIAKGAAKAGIFALGAGAVVAAKGLYDMAEAAVEDEAAQARLAQTLRNTSGATDAQIAAVERWITAQGKALGVTDDELRPAMQRLAEATGDVGKAQDLVTLAMDVSAAKQKPLVTVSEALMKAYNGNIGALGRLGIKTKDAAGETISFEQATRQMADTFGGAAEKNAETLGGKLARLKLIVGEAGEEIGGKLLPYVEDAADVFVDKGVPAITAFGDKAGPVFRDIVEGAGDMWDAVQPAVEEIGEALGNLATEGEGAGKVFSGVFIPALEKSADVVGTLVNFVDELPGPVKDIGIQAGIAALVLPKFAAGLEATKKSATGLSATLRDTESRTRLLGDAARTAAGIGGMVLLAEGAQQADARVSVLMQTLGGAGLGAMAGPFGALAGAAGGFATAMVGVARETRDAQDAAREGAATWQDYASTLDGVTAALTESSRKMVYTSLQQQDLLGVAGQLGISETTLVNGIIGQERARERLTAAIAAERAEVEEIIEATNMSKEEYDSLTKAEQDAFQAHAKEVDARRNNIEALEAEIGVLKESIQQKIEEIAVVKQIPKRVVTEFFQNGVVKGIEDVRELAEQYDLTPKQVRTIVKATNVDVTRKDLRALLGDLEETDKQRPKPFVDLDDKSFVPKYKRVMAELRELDRQQVNPKTDLSLDEYYRRRAELLNSLRTIPDETVTIWTTRREANGGGFGPQDDAGGGSGVRRMVMSSSSALTGYMASPTASRIAAASRRWGSPSGARAGGQAPVVVRFPERMTLRIGDRSFEAYVEDIARDSAREDRIFARQQVD